MADLNTAQKAPVTVTTAAGAAVPLNAVTVSVDAGGAISWAAGPRPDGTPSIYVVGEHEGTGTLTVQYGNQTGTLTVSVAEAPLSLVLGTPEPK